MALAPDQLAQPKPFADPIEAMEAMTAAILPFLELHRVGARGEHDSLFSPLYDFMERLGVTELRPPVVNVCHTMGDDAVTGGYLTFTYADGRRVEHPLDLYGATMLLRQRLPRDPNRRTSLEQEQEKLLRQMEEKLAVSATDRKW